MNIDNIFIRKSFYAGILIGIGDIIYLSLENKTLAAMLFSIGLLTIIHQQLNLYTGKIGFINLSFLDYLMMLFWNFLGAMISVKLALIAKPELIKPLLQIADKKFTYNYLQILLLGVLCGMCMYIAVSCKNIVITIFAIMTFILCGFEHCIADFPYLIYSNNIMIVSSVLKFILIIVGNSIGAVFLHLLETIPEGEPT